RAPPRAIATLPRLVAVSIPTAVTSPLLPLLPRCETAAAQEFRHLGLLMVPLEKERRPDLEPARLPLDLLHAHHARAQGHARWRLRTLADDAALLADRVRRVALEQETAAADVERRLPRLAGRPLPGGADADADLPARHLEADVVAALPVVDADAVAAARL